MICLSLFAAQRFQDRFRFCVGAVSSVFYDFFGLLGVHLLLSVGNKGAFSLILPTASFMDDSSPPDALARTDMYFFTKCEQSERGVSHSVLSCTATKHNIWRMISPRLVCLNT
jgi:hypothetical protein